MHKLTRSVRFSINPFLPADAEGANPYTSRPAGEGLSFFFDLSVSLTGQVEPSTGFIVNVTEIDCRAGQFVVPVAAEALRKNFGEGRHIGLCKVAKMLRVFYQNLSGRFGNAEVSELRLKLNPFRTIAVDCGDLNMIYFSEKFEFAATHKLWNDSLSDRRNFEVFGKCASKAGHGHNYIVEVTVKSSAEGDGLRIGDFERTVSEELIELVDHKNLNLEVAEFRENIPTVENIAVFAWDRLAGRFGQAQLHCVTVWETDKTCCSYFG